MCEERGATPVGLPTTMGSLGSMICTPLILAPISYCLLSSALCPCPGVTVDMEERFCELVKDMGCTCITIR